ncbi:MAG: XRE family transcriptional regulator [Erysipelotrichaceae bacterium]|nr:XRE family transcriptional regulator [Erysipelotrichaceae bacterium]
MICELRHFDTTLLRFSYQSGADPDVRILWTNEDKRNLFPLDLTEISAEVLEAWVRHRVIPRNRAYADTIVSSLALSMNRPFDILRVSKGLSLNDCYWVTDQDFEGTFDQYNLYDNRFSRILGQIAFTGYGTEAGNRAASSPELTTNGMLPKCWRRENGIIKLYKGGTSGASNTGNEPYSEFLASQIAAQLGINAVTYGLSKWKNTLCSTCELFTSKDISYVPVGRIVRKGGMKAVRAYYESLGEDYVNALNDMIVFDAVILNTDRHFGNFGFLVDSHSNQIIAPAPLFDHGNSLLNFAGAQALSSEEALVKYAGTLLPCVYDSFIDEAKNVMTHEHRMRLRSLLEFRFGRHTKYNLPKERITMLEEVVHSQIQKLLD